MLQRIRFPFEGINIFLFSRSGGTSRNWNGKFLSQELIIFFIQIRKCLGTAFLLSILVYSMKHEHERKIIKKRQQNISNLLYNEY